MSVKSALLSFTSDDHEIGTKVQDILKNHLCNDMQLVINTPLFGGDMTIYGSESSLLTATMRIYNKRNLITLNLEETNDDMNYLSNLIVEKLCRELKNLLNTKVERIPIVKRATDVPNYYTSSDERILEYDFQKILFEKNSDYQHVKILQSPSLGNCLILDDLQNLAEADINYTRALMKYGQLDYNGKDILILGGGDGGLIHELLKENPKFVTMVDIDKMVIDSCSKHLRGACGNTLDNLNGDNYKIIVGDCIKFMEQCMEENITFDVVFNDLTDIPISDDDSKAGDLMRADTEEMWAFVRRIIVLAMQLIRPNGRYLNHAIGIGCVSALNAYEELLKSLNVRVNFSRHTAYVPSFMEEWVFYDVWKV